MSKQLSHIPKMIIAYFWLPHLIRGVLSSHVSNISPRGPPGRFWPQNPSTTAASREVRNHNKDLLPQAPPSSLHPLQQRQPQSHSKKSRYNSKMIEIQTISIEYCQSKCCSEWEWVGFFSFCVIWHYLNFTSFGFVRNTSLLSVFFFGEFCVNRLGYVGFCGASVSL